MRARSHRARRCAAIARQAARVRRLRAPRPCGYRCSQGQLCAALSNERDRCCSRAGSAPDDTTPRVDSRRGRSSLRPLLPAVAVGRWRARPRIPRPSALTVTSSPGGEGMPSSRLTETPLSSPGGGPDPNETNDLWVKAVDGDALRRLTDTPQLHEAMLAWSPDGRQIAFYTTEGGTSSGVFLVSSLGGPVRKVASGGIDRAWTPDGQLLVIATNREGEDRGIFVQRLEGGTRRQFTRPPMGFLDSYPKVSPDGKTLAFGRSSGRKKNALSSCP